jgi:hypothetical protein
MIAPTTKRRRLTGLSIKETSGVDRPANRSQVGADGWLVMKADGTPFTPAEIARRWPAQAEAEAEAVLHAELGEARAVLAAACARQAVKKGTSSTVPKTEEGHVSRPTVVNKSAAWAAIEKSAGDFRLARAAAGEDISREMAIAKVTELRPDLAAAYRGAVEGPVIERGAGPASPSPHVLNLDQHVEALAKSRGITKSAAYDDLDAQGLRLLAVVKQAQGRRLDAKCAAEAAERRRLGVEVTEGFRVGCGSWPGIGDHRRREPPCSPAMVLPPSVRSPDDT